MKNILNGHGPSAPAIAIALSTGYAVLAGTGASDAGDWRFWRRKPHPPACYDMGALSEEAAEVLQAGKSLQVRNGEIQSRTIRGHHFEYVETTDENTLETVRQLALHASGKGELERLARRQQQMGHVEVFLEASHNPAFIGTPEEVRAANDDRDAQQAKLIIDYLQRCLGCTTVTVMLIETPRVGLEGVEGMAAFRRGLRSFTSTIPGSYFNATGAAGGDPAGGDNSLFVLPGGGVVAPVDGVAM